MRAYEIALFILIFNITLSVVATTGLFANSVEIQADTSFFNFISTTVQATDYEPPTLIDAFALSASLAVLGVINFIVIILDTAGMIPFTLARTLGLSPFDPLVLTIQIGIWFVYGVGIAQFFRGVSTKEME